MEKKTKHRIDLTGKKFNYLLVLRESDKQAPYKHTFWLCRCDCGNLKDINAYSIKSGITKSCGCYNRIRKSRFTHGKRHTPLYEVWHGMKQRTRNIKNWAYHYYGGRGIDMCNSWYNSFEKFYIWSMNNGYKKGLTIERIDNDKGYNPKNCKWATMLEQSKNKRPRTKKLSTNHK